MVLEYVEGKVIREFTDETLVEIAEKLKKLHETQFPRENDLLISDWTRRNITEKSKKLGEVRSEVLTLWDGITRLHDGIQPLIEDYPDDSLIHDDPILGNFIQTDDGIRLIDWELAHGDYFFMELGGFIEENGVTPHQEKVFLDAYGFGSTIDEQRILAFSKAYRIAAIVGWFIERIVALNEGEKMFIDADVDEYWANLRGEMKHLARLL